MRRAGSRTADGWWLLLITVLGWLLVSYGSHRGFGGDTQQADVERRQLQTIDVTTRISPLNIAAPSTPTGSSNVATSLSPTSNPNLTAIIADQVANAASPSPSPAETLQPPSEATAAATPEATSAGVTSQYATDDADAPAPSPDPSDYGNSSFTSPSPTPTDATVFPSGIQTPAQPPLQPPPTPVALSPSTATPTPIPTPVTAAAPPPSAPSAAPPTTSLGSPASDTSAPMPAAAGPPLDLASPPAAPLPPAPSQPVSVPVLAPNLGSNASAPSPVDASVPTPATDQDTPNAPALAPNASSTTQNTTAPAVAPAAGPPTEAATVPAPAPAALTTLTNSTAPVPAPSQDAAVPVPAPGLLLNAPAPAPGLVPAPAPAPGSAVPAPAPAPIPGLPVPAPAQGVPAPAPAVAVPIPAPAPAVVAPVPAPKLAVVAPVPVPASSVPAPAPSAAAGGVPVPAPAVGSPSPGAPAPAPGSAGPAGSAGGLLSNSTGGNPAAAPAPGTAAVPTPAASAPAVASAVAEPALAPVSTTQDEYLNVADAPASWNSSEYSTTTFQVLLTNTSFGEFDSASERAVMNVVHRYVQDYGQFQEFYMGVVSISQYLPSEFAPGVNVNLSRTPSESPTARRLLQAGSSGGVNMTITITAPASQMRDLADLVQSVVQSPPVRRQLQEAGVAANLDSVSVVVEISGLPPVTVPAADIPGVAAPPPPPSSKSSSIGPIAGGIAGSVVLLSGGAGLAVFLCKRRRRRRQWTKDLEVAKASYGEEGTSNSGDSGSSGGSARPGGLGRKVAAYMPFGTNSNESVDATPHAKHARMDDGFAGISRFKPDGTLKVPPPRPAQLISSTAGMGTIPERNAFSAPAAKANGAHLHDTANLLDSHTHSNNVQTAADHVGLSPTSLFSFGTPVGRNSDPFRTPGLPSRPSDGRLSSDGSTNLLLRGGSGDGLLAVQASGEYSDRFQEQEPVGGRKSSRQYSGNVDANLWSVAWKDLEIQKQIGEGSFGKVFLAKWRETTVAVKLLTYTGVSGSLEDNDEFVAQGMNVLLKGLEQEAGMMAAMRHPNVVMYLGVCLQPPCVVTEYCARGSLNDVFKRARATPALAAQLDWGRRLNMVLDAAKGMMYLHSSEPPVIHRDLKSPNLLVDKHWRLKVCDFNLSRVMEESAILSSMAASNPRWLAPEILSGRGYTFSSDVYSFGVIMWEFLTWQIPWHECGPWQVVALVTEGAQRPELPAPEDLPGSGTFAGYSEYIMLMEQCWDQDPAARPTFAQVITVLRKLLGAEMKAKASNNAELRPQSSNTPSE